MPNDLEAIEIFQARTQTKQQGFSLRLTRPQVELLLMFDAAAQISHEMTEALTYRALDLDTGLVNNYIQRIGPLKKMGLLCHMDDEHPGHCYLSPAGNALIPLLVQGGHCLPEEED